MIEAKDTVDRNQSDGKRGKWQVDQGEMEHSSGDNFIGYSGNHMGVFTEGKPPAEFKEQDISGLPDCYLCGYAE